MLKIDKATCLCLVDRESEWLELEKQVAEKGWDYERLLAGSSMYSSSYALDWEDVDNPDVSGWGYGREGYKHHHWNAFQCHQIMIQRAIEEGRKNLLILEDDAYITDRFDTVFSAIPDDLQYDILYLGWWIGQESDIFNKNIEQEYAQDGIIRVNRAVQIGGLHGALINRSMFQFISQLPPNNPIDFQLNMYHHLFKNFYVAPKIIHTKSMFSVCEGYVIDRNKL